jgi:signal peptidase I
MNNARWGMPSGNEMEEGEQQPAPNPEEPAPVSAPQAPPPRTRRRTASAVAAFVVSAAAVLLRVFVFETDIVEGKSMEPGLRSGDFVLLYKLGREAKTPRRFEVITFRAPNSKDVLIKRVVGLPGDWVWIWGNRVFVNGGYLEEPYLGSWRGQYEAPVWVPRDSIFVMGDNRDDSEDSRRWGPIPLSSVRGKAVAVFFPFGHIGVIR